MFARIRCAVKTQTCTLTVVIRCSVFACVVFVSSLGAQTSRLPAYIGSQVCQGCHSGPFATQGKTGHAGALHRAAQHPLASVFAPTSPLRRGEEFRFDFHSTGGQLGVQVSGPRDVVDVPLDWAFGSGVQAVTFVSKISKDWYLENYFSYYAATNSLGPTPGQGALQPKELREAVGLLYETADPRAGILGCFECHSTGPVSFGAEGEIAPTEAGVHCEVCHGPGSNHVQSPTKESIVNPRRMSAAQMNEFCGRCHRTPGSDGSTPDWNYAWNVRHQPIYLGQSSCFTKSEGALSCLTCHQPHEALRRNDAAYYGERCATCHNSETNAPPPVCATDSGSSCIDCHMPRVSPQAYLQFTNHWIGVYGEGAKLKPLR